jgi:hypothetical protein
MEDIDINILDVQEIRELAVNINNVIHEWEKIKKDISDLSSQASVLTRKFFDILFPNNQRQHLFSQYPEITLAIASPFCKHNAYFIIRDPSKYGLSYLEFRCSCKNDECNDIYSSLDHNIIVLYVFIRSLPKLKEVLQSMLQIKQEKRKASEKEYEMLRSMMNKLNDVLKPYILAKELVE